MTTDKSVPLLPAMKKLVMIAFVFLLAGLLAGVVVA
jgi:hypothetical protein